jgi:MAE_28990/MAE_18760-like HEPN
MTGNAVNILELQQHLDELSAWRKDELSLARSLAEQATDGAARRYLCRAWTLIMYAHCDNFLKMATECYVEYIKDNIPMNYRIDSMWLIFKGKEHVKQASRKYVSPFHPTENFETYFSTIKSDAVFRERSFGYKALRFFCDWVLQIQFAHLEKKWFCESLERKRNAIAHGEEAYIDDIQDCVKWHEDTLKFMDDLKDAILLGAPNSP